MASKAPFVVFTILLASLMLASAKDKDNGKIKDNTPYAVQFTGSQFIDLPTITLGNSFSIEFLVRWRGSIDSTDTQVLFLGTNNKEKIGVRIVESDSFSAFVVLDLADKQGNLASAVSGSAVIPVNQWIYVAITAAADGTRLTQVTFWIQHASDASPTKVSSSPIFVVTPGVSRTNGAIGYDPSSKNNNKWLNADIDEVRLWKTSGITIGKDLQGSVKDSFNKENLILYLQFEEGNGYKTADSSKYGNDDATLGSKKSNAPTWIGAGFGLARSCAVFGKKTWVKTFDRYVYGETAWNTYVLAQGTPSLLNMQIKIDDNTLGRGNTISGVAWKYQGDLVVLDLDYRTASTQRVIINNQTRTDDFFSFTSGLAISKDYSGSKLVFNIQANDDWSMQIISKPRQASTSVTLKLPAYQWKSAGITGICGDYDGITSNDNNLAGSFTVDQASSFFASPTSSGADGITCDIPTSSPLYNQANTICNDPTIIPADFSDSCFFDICATQDVGAASVVAQTAYDTCLEENGANTTTGNPCVQPCPGFCSFQGTCNSDGTCSCKSGYGGADCSQQASYKCYTASWASGSFPLTPFIGNGDVTNNYNYERPLTHSANSGNEISDSSVFYLYQRAGDDSALSFVWINDKPRDGSGGSMTATFTTANKNTNQALPVSLKVKDDSSNFDSYDTNTAGKITARWRWDSCCTDGLAFTGNNLQTTPFCIKVSIPSVSGISQIFASSQNLFGEQDIEFVPLSDRSSLQICGDTCTNPCGQYSSCNTCQSNSQCGWCADSGTCELGTAGGPNNGRCSLWRYNYTRSRVVTANPSYPIDPSDIQVYMGAQNLGANFFVNLPDPANVPLEVVIVQELTNSLLFDLISLKLIVPLVIDGIRNSYSNARIGFATFSDKPVYPYGAPNKDYAFNSHIKLTTDMNAVKRAINGVNALNGGDSLNSQLDALLIAAASDMGWSANSRRVVLLITKSGYHTPTGTFAKPNNGDDLAESNEDYPTTQQVYNALLNNNVVPIILTTDSLARNVYGPLVNSWGFGTAITYSLFSMPDQVTSALDEIGGNVAAFIQTPGRVTSVSAPYYGVSPLSRVAFTATVSATSTSTDPAVIVIPGFGKVTISTLSDDAPSTITCGANPVSCSSTTVIRLRGISTVYGDQVSAQIMSVPTVGKLFQFGTSTVINANDFVADPGLQVIYDPQGNCDANFTATFTYRIVDTCSVCSAVDSCGVIVIGQPPVYPPPIATPTGPLETPLDNLSDPYPLNGTGIGGSGFLQSFIFDLPSIGTLLQVDGVTPIDISQPVPGGVVVYSPPPGLEQILDPSDGTTKRAGGTSLTSFSYVVQDTRTGSFSSPAGVPIIPKPPNNPPPPPHTITGRTFICQEDTVCTVNFTYTGDGAYVRLWSLPWWTGEDWNPSLPLLGTLSTCPNMSCVVTHTTSDTGDLGTRILYYLPPKDYASGNTIYFQWEYCCGPSLNANNTMFINGTNDAPVSSNVVISADENSVGNVINLNGSDVDAGDELTYFIDTWTGVGGTLYLDGQILGLNQNNPIGTIGQLTFTPAPNTFGDVSFSYYVKDREKVRSTPSSTVTINVHRVSYPATASAPSTISSSQLNYTTIHLSGANQNGDATLSIILDQAPVSGTLYFSGVPLNSGDTITSATGANIAADVVFFTAGTSDDVFTFHVASSLDDPSAPQNVNVHVVALPLPTLIAPVSSFTFDQETNTTVTFQASSANSQTISYFITHLPQNAEIHQLDESGNDAGVYTINTAISNSLGNVRFVGLYGKFGPDSFTWMATDGEGISSGTQTVEFTVNFVNHAPVALDNPDVSVSEDGQVIIPLAANDRDTGAVLTYTIQDSLSGSAGGVIEVCATAQCDSVTESATAGTTVGSGAVRYTPAVHKWGSATFTFKATDQYNVSSNTATVTITVQKVLYNPFVVTSEQGATVNDADAGIFLYLNGSDYNYPRSALGFSIINPTFRGKLFQSDKTTQITTSDSIFDPEQAVWYVPNLNIQPYSPYDIITYQIVNPDGLFSAEGTYDIFVTHTYLPPVARNATIDATENGANVAITLGSFDPNGLDSSLVAFISTPTSVFPLVDAATQATLIAESEVSAPFNVIYVPQNFSYGSPLDSFTFYVKNTDTGLISAPATITINMPRGFHNPVWVDPRATATEDTPTIIQLTGYDPDGDALTCKWVGGFNHGTWYEYDMSTGNIIAPALQNGDPFVFWPCYAKYFPDPNWDGLTGKSQTQVSYSLFKSTYPSFSSGASPFIVTMIPVPDPPMMLFNVSQNGTIVFSNVGLLGGSNVWKFTVFDPDSPPTDPINAGLGDWTLHFNQMPTFGDLYSFPNPFNQYNNLSQTTSPIYSTASKNINLDQQSNLIPYWNFLISYTIKEQNYGHQGIDIVSFYITDETNLRSQDITYTFVINGTTSVPVPTPAEYSMTLDEGVGHVGLLFMNATNNGTGALRFEVTPTAAWSAVFKTPKSLLLTWLPPTGVTFIVNTTNADFNTGSGTGSPLIACYKLYNIVTNAYYRGGASTCSLYFYIRPVNDDPTITSTQTYSSNVATRVINDVVLGDIDCTTGDQVCSAFNLELIVQEGANVATIAQADTNGVSCSGSNVHLVCIGALENLNSMLSTGLTVTAVGTLPLTAHITVNVFDNGNVGTTFRNGTATQTLTVQFSTQQAGGASQQAPLSASLVGGTTLISSSLYGLYRLMRKRKLLPEDANPWETDDAFDNTNDNPLFTGMPTTSAATTVTMVAN